MFSTQAPPSRDTGDNPLSRLPPHLRPGGARLASSASSPPASVASSKRFILLSCLVGFTLLLVGREFQVYADLKIEVAELRDAVGELRSIVSDTRPVATRREIDDHRTRGTRREVNEAGTLSDASSVTGAEAQHGTQHCTQHGTRSIPRATRTEIGGERTSGDLGGLFDMDAAVGGTARVSRSRESPASGAGTSASSSTGLRARDAGRKEAAWASKGSVKDGELPWD